MYLSNKHKMFFSINNITNITNIQNEANEAKELNEENEGSNEENTDTDIKEEKQYYPKNKVLQNINININKNKSIINLAIFLPRQNLYFHYVL